jgi:hypothetical protein
MQANATDGGSSAYYTGGRNGGVTSAIPAALTANIDTLLNSNDTLLASMKKNLESKDLTKNHELMKKFNDTVTSAVSKLDEITHVVMPAFPLTVDLSLLEEKSAKK